MTLEYLFIISYKMTDTIKTQFNNDLVKASKEVLQQWIQGKGKMPVNWNTIFLSTEEDKTFFLLNKSKIP